MRTTLPSWRGVRKIGDYLESRGLYSWQRAWERTREEWPRVRFVRPYKRGVGHVRIVTGKPGFGIKDLARAGPAHRIEHARRPATSAAGPLAGRRQLLPVVKDFMARVSEQAVGEAVLKSLNPTNQLVYIVHQELINLMGPVDHSLHLRGDVIGADALRPAGVRQNDHLRQAGPVDPASTAASRCWWRPTCSGPRPSSNCR